MTELQELDKQVSMYRVALDYCVTALALAEHALRHPQDGRIELTLKHIKATLSDMALIGVSPTEETQEQSH